jgi:hypothetical protein
MERCDLMNHTVSNTNIPSAEDREDEPSRPLPHEK